MSDNEVEFDSWRIQDQPSAQRLTPEDQAPSDGEQSLPEEKIQTDEDSSASSTVDTDKPDLNWAPSNPMQDIDLSGPEKKASREIDETKTRTPQSIESEKSEVVLETESVKKEGNENQPEEEIEVLNIEEIQVEPKCKIDTEPKEESELEAKEEIDQETNGEIDPETKEEIEVMNKEEIEVIPTNEFNILIKEEVDVGPKEQINLVQKEEVEVEPKDEIKFIQKEEVKVEPTEEIEIFRKEQVSLEPSPEIQLAAKAEVDLEPNQEVQIITIEDNYVDPIKEEREADEDNEEEEEVMVCIEKDEVKEVVADTNVELMIVNHSEENYDHGEETDEAVSDQQNLSPKIEEEMSGEMIQSQEELEKHERAEQERINIAKRQEEVEKHQRAEQERSNIAKIEWELKKTKEMLEESKKELAEAKNNSQEFYWILQAKNGNYIECYVRSENSPIRASAPSCSVSYALKFASHPGFGAEEFVIMDTASQLIWKQNPANSGKPTISLESETAAKLKKYPDAYRFLVHQVDKDVLLQTKTSKDKEPVYVSFIDGVFDIVLLSESQCSDDSIIFKKFEIKETREIMSKIKRGSMTPQELEGLLQCDSMTIAHSRINYRELNLDAYKNVPNAVLEIIIPVFSRKDADSTGYAGLVDFLDEFLRFAGEILPPEVTRKMQELRNALGTKCCVHIKSILSCLDRYYKLDKDRVVRMAKLAQCKMDEDVKEQNAVEYDVLVRRLDERILRENPALKDWQRSGKFQRWWQDFRRRKKLKDHANGSAGFPLWRHSLLKIQSNFGESTMAYFEFIRWLFLLNLFAAVLYGGIILLPGALNEQWTTDEKIPVDENLAWKLLGRQRNSFYYWGYYNEFYYNGNLDMQLAWLAVATIVIITALVSIINRVLGGDFHKVEKGAMPFCKNVFAAYDHSLINSEARQLVQNGIMIRLHETLLEELDTQMNEVNFSIILKRILGVLSTVLVAIVTVFCIMALITYENLISKAAVEQYPAAVILAEYITPAGVNVINALYPIILNKLVTYEQWSAGIQFQQKFFRTFILRMFSIIVTLFVTDNAAGSFVVKEGEEFCKMSVIGEMLLKFIILATLLEIGKKVIMPFSMYHLKNCCNLIEKDEEKDKDSKMSSDLESAEKREIIAKLAVNMKKGKTDFFEMKGDSWKSEFSIPNALVDAMYYQGLMWSAMPFCPAAMPWGAMLNIVTFFTTKFYVMNYCCRPKQALGVVHQLKFFYGCILLTLGVASIPIIWLLREKPTCGPIKDQTVRQNFDAKLLLAPSEVVWTIDFLTSAVILVPVITTLIMYLKYFRNKYQRKNEQKKSLEDQLMAEKLEKEQIIRDYNVRM